jgi:hypothetical protein
MDYLYDKVQLYDAKTHHGYGKTDNNIPPVKKLFKRHRTQYDALLEENHDEQQLQVPGAGNFKKGKPTMVVSATISTITAVYFGQGR